MRRWPQLVSYIRKLWHAKVERVLIRTDRLDHSDYLKFRDFVLRETGLYFPDKRRADLERGILEALAKSTHQTVEDYYKAITENPENGDMSKLVSELTIGETYFNRDAAQFALLEREILPKLISERVATTRTLRIWSAGCASGEEPYSLAILLRELIPYIDTWDITIMATDIDRDSIDKAHKGRYGQWSFRAMPTDWLDKYFFVSTPTDFYLSDAIKQHVSFDQLNLKENCFPSVANNTNDLDLIICRNVAIYFDQDTTTDLMSKFHGCLRDGAWLMVGASDPIPPPKIFAARNHSGTFIYQKLSPGFDARKTKRPKRAKATKAKAPVRAAQTAARKKKIDTTGDLIKEGKTLLEIGQATLALDKLKQALRSSPRAVEPLLLAARAEIGRGNLPEAQEFARRVTKADKLNVDSYFLLSTIAQGLGDDDQAIIYLKKAIYLSSKFIAAHFTLACLYKKCGQGIPAKKYFKNVIGLMIEGQEDEIVPESNGITFGKLREIAESNLG